MAELLPLETAAASDPHPPSKRSLLSLPEQQEVVAGMQPAQGVLTANHTLATGFNETKVKKWRCHAPQPFRVA